MVFACLLIECEFNMKSGLNLLMLKVLDKSTFHSLEVRFIFIDTENILIFHWK